MLVQHLNLFHFPFNYLSFSPFPLQIHIFLALVFQFDAFILLDSSLSLRFSCLFLSFSSVSLIFSLLINILPQDFLEGLFSFSVMGGVSSVDRERPRRMEEHPLQLEEHPQRMKE